eukprot:GGOE01046914.1.p1 GENE.GGOE01046914.1~~GGOE01046914.1.p1  ORF type:complete len:757 (-),score=159.45 GGOE01046914.1:1649-3919(-)
MAGPGGMPPTEVMQQILGDLADSNPGLVEAISRHLEQLGIDSPHPPAPPPQWSPVGLPAWHVPGPRQADWAAHCVDAVLSSSPKATLLVIAPSNKLQQLLQTLEQQCACQVHPYCFLNTPSQPVGLEGWWTLQALYNVVGVPSDAALSMLRQPSAFPLERFGALLFDRGSSPDPLLEVFLAERLQALPLCCRPWFCDISLGGAASMLAGGGPGRQGAVASSTQSDSSLRPLAPSAAPKLAGVGRAIPLSCAATLGPLPSSALQPPGIVPGYYLPYLQPAASSCFGDISVPIPVMVRIPIQPMNEPLMFALGQQPSLPAQPTLLRAQSQPPVPPPPLPPPQARFLASRSQVQQLMPPATPVDSGVVHPFIHPSGTEVNIINCVEVFFGYCRALLGADFDTMQLLEYRGFNRNGESMLHAVHYPNSEGFTKVSKKQVKQIWNGRNLHEVLAQYHSPELHVTDSQKRWFLYAVVLDIIAKGFMGHDNLPTSQLLQQALTNRAQGMYDMQPPVRPSGPWDNPLQTFVTQQKEAVAHLDEEGSVTDAWLPNRDPKSLLNELRHKMAAMVLSYDTKPIAHKLQSNYYQSTLHLQYEGQLYSFAGEASLGKKFAEQSAALAAVRFISRGGLGRGLSELGQGAEGSTLTPSTEQSLNPVAEGSPAPPDAEQPCRTCQSLLLDLLHTTFGLEMEPTPVQYTSEAVQGGWQATAHIATPFGTCSFSGRWDASRVASEESAALAALTALSSVGPQSSPPPASYEAHP